METCSEALNYYFDAMVVLTVMGAAGWFLVILLFTILYYMSKTTQRIKREALEALKEAGYFDD